MITLQSPLTAQAVITGTTAPSIGKFNIYNATGGNIATTLPALSGLNVGARLSVGKYVGDSSTNTVTVNCSGSDKFQDGSTASLVLRETGSQRELQVIEVSSTKYWQIVGGIVAPTATLVTTTNAVTMTNKSLTSPKIVTSILDTNGNTLLNIGATTNAVNYLYLKNDAAGGWPGINTQGADSTVPLAFNPKGGQIIYYASAGVTPTILAKGGDTNVSLNLTTQGSGTVQANSVEVATVSGTQSLTNKSITSPKIVTSLLDTNGATLMGVTATGSAVNYLNVTNAAASGKPTFSCAGSDTNIGMSFDAKGSGQQVMRDGTGAIRAIFSGNAGNYFAFDAASTPTILLDGASTDVGMTITTKGAGTVTVYVPTGQTSVVRASGVDAAVNLDLRSKGTGVVQINSNTAVSRIPVSLTTTATLGAVAGAQYIVLLGTGAVPTLPTAVGNTSTYNIKNTTTGTITLSTTSSQTIDGSTTLNILTMESYTIVSDNTNWWII